MSGTMVLVELAGYVALLLWGTRMVQSGVVRAYGADLRRVLGRCLANRFAALASGIGVTALLQSSTATGLMVTSFAAIGMVDLMPALAVMLGANIGTTLIVQALSFDLSWLAPLLFLLGLLAFKRGRTRMRDLGRVAIGLGLMLLSLHLLIAAIEPTETAPAMRALFGAVTREPVLALLLAAVLTWAAHSSAAIVLLILSLAQTGVVTPVESLALVLGANLGSAVNPLIEGAGGDDPAHRRLPLGNLLTRVAGCLIFLPLAGPIAALLARGEPGVARQVVDFHTAFNLAVALAFLGFLGPFARLLEWLLPGKPASRSPQTPRHLDPQALGTPALALAAAERETLRLADMVEAMLQGTVAAFAEDDRKRVGEIERMNRVLDRLTEAVKRYLVQIDPEAMNERDQKRYANLLAYVINLAHAGDIVDRNLMPMAAARTRRGLRFSAEGAAEIGDMLSRLVDNLRLSLAVLMSGDEESARRLIGEKEVVRSLERRATDSHFARLREGRLESLETSALHLDILRDARRINAHLAAAANPVLEEMGQLRPSRLREAEGVASARPSTQPS